jgi:alkylation response protein AidB-like acyl-CoA dehydrogenase
MQSHYRDARLSTIGGGTSEIQKNVTARELGL